MEMTFKNTENSNMNEPDKLVLNLSQRLGLRISSKHVTLQNCLLRVEKYKTTVHKQWI